MTISRRKFLYAGIGAAAVAGMGYLTKDYWLPSPQGLTPESATISTSPQSPQQTFTDTPTVPQIETSTSIPTEKATTIIEMSEDEVLIRELLEEEWVQAYNAENKEQILNLYTSDATLDFTVRANKNILKGRQQITYNYKWLRDYNARIENFKILKLEISENKAEVSSKYSWFSAKVGGMGFSDFQLVKTDSITRGNREWKLEKPVWRIKYETTRLVV